LTGGSKAKGAHALIAINGWKAARWLRYDRQESNNAASDVKSALYKSAQMLLSLGIDDLKDKC